jgi:SecD/SecF fusion protein
MERTANREVPMKLIVFLAAVVFFLGCGRQEVVHPGVTLHLTIELDDSHGAIANPDSAINRLLSVIRARVDEFGPREARIERVGEDRIIVELAGVQDVAWTKWIIQQRGFLEFKVVTNGVGFLEQLPAMDSVIVATLGEATPPLTSLLFDSGQRGIYLAEDPQVETVQGYLEIPEVRARIPDDVSLHWGTEVRAIAGKTYTPLYITEAEPLITGEHLVETSAIRDPQNDTPIVPFRLTRQGGRIFERGTSRHVGDYMAIILDGKVLGDPPVIRDVISDRGQIELGTGSTLAEAVGLALILRIGALPAPIKIVEERTIAPKSRPE